MDEDGIFSQLVLAVLMSRLSCLFTGSCLILQSDQTLIMSVPAFTTETFVQHISSVTFSGKLSKGLCMVEYRERLLLTQAMNYDEPVITL